MIDDLKQGKQEGFDIVLEKSTGGGQPNDTPRNPVNDIPSVFCAGKELAKEILIEITALSGALHGIEIGEVDPNTAKIVLSNGQRILTNLGNLIVRDCNLTESDMDDISKVFEAAVSQSPQKG